MCAAALAKGLMTSGTMETVASNLAGEKYQVVQVDGPGHNFNSHPGVTMVADTDIPNEETSGDPGDIPVADSQDQQGPVSLYHI